MVGGAVRDTLLGREPKDFDYVIVGGSAADLLAKGYQQVGADFPVFLHEYALARVERKTGDGYGGFTVETDGVSLEDDLGRRDLTINSMAIDIETNELFDPFHGRADLHNHVLRHTSPAFSEDPLRVLRLARFGARFENFTVAPETTAMCQALCATGELNALSIERVWVELEKGFSETSPARFMELLDQLSALEHCRVLSDIFGHWLSHEQAVLAERVATVDVGHRLFVAIAVLMQNGGFLRGANNRTEKCAENFSSLKFLQATATELYKLIKQARGFGEGQSYNDLVLCAMVAESAGFRPRLSSRKLINGHRVAKEITAAQYPSVQGRELGAAIERGRIEAIAQALNIPI
jgi:hypothetical protein